MVFPDPEGEKEMEQVEKLKSGENKKPHIRHRYATDPRLTNEDR